jgi:hypothetical protein
MVNDPAALTAIEESVWQRRSYFDWAAETRNKPHWVVVQDITGKRLEHRKLEIGTDLIRVLIENLARWSNDGWNVEVFSSNSSGFFRNRGSERRNVSIMPTDPTKSDWRSYRAPERKRTRPQA